MNTERRRRRDTHPLLLLIILTALAWPSLVAAGTLLALIGGDAWQLGAWQQIPKRVLLQHFLDGYRQSLIPALLVGALGVIDHLLIGRSARLRSLRGILLPIAAALAAWLLLPSVSTALATLVLGALLLVVASRLIPFLARLMIYRFQRR